MSGGALDYSDYKLEDAIQTIEKRIANNGKTILQLWNEKTEDEKHDCYNEWEKPWDFINHPFYVDDIASDYAWKELAKAEKKYAVSFNVYDMLTAKSRKLWNKFKNESIKQQIDARNNSCDGIVYSDEAIEAMKTMLATIKKAKAYLHSIDYLLAGDDGENDLIETLKNNQ